MQAAGSARLVSTILAFNLSSLHSNNCISRPAIDCHDGFIFLLSQRIVAIHITRHTAIYPSQSLPSHANTVSVYNKWHENELERWLSDHAIPYPAAADRKELENLVKENWNTKISAPYTDWDTAQLSAYLKDKGIETKETAKEAAAESKDGLISSVKNSWYETEDKADDAWSSVKDWIFDSWTGETQMLNHLIFN